MEVGLCADMQVSESFNPLPDDKRPCRALSTAASSCFLSDAIGGNCRIGLNNSHAQVPNAHARFPTV